MDEHSYGDEPDERQPKTFQSAEPGTVEAIRLIQGRKRACLPVLLSAFLALCAGCGRPPSVEQQVIAAITEMQQAIEAGERRAFMQHVAGDFRGQHEQMNRDQLNAFVLLELRRHADVQARLFPVRVVETGSGRAEASFQVLVTGGAGWLPERGQLLDISSHWKQAGDRWLLVSAEWEPVELVAPGD